MSEPSPTDPSPLRARLMLPAFGAIALAAGTAPALAALVVGAEPRAPAPVVHVDLARAVHADALGRLWGARRRAQPVTTSSNRS